MSAQQNRISGHMNRDHQLALVDYLVVYGNKPLSEFKSETVEIVQVDEKSVTLQFQTKNGINETVDIAWNSAQEDESVTVKSLSDLKAKLVAMAKYAAKKQGYSHKQVSSVIYPNTVPQLSTYAFLAAVSVTLIDRTRIRRLLQTLGKIPGPGDKLLSFFETRIIGIAATLYAIHLLEALFITLPKTRKYRMPLKPTLEWCTMNFVEGFFMWPRLDKALED